LTFTEGAANNWSAVYLRDELNASPAIAASVVTIFLISITLGRLGGDRLSATVGAVGVFRLGALIGSVGLGGALLVQTTWAGLVGFAALGLGLSVMLPVAIAAAGIRSDVSTATAVARVATLGYLGSFVAPAVIGGANGVIGLTGALFIPAVLLIATVPLARVLHPAPDLAPVGVPD